MASEIDDDPRTLTDDRAQRSVQLATAVAARRAQHVAGQALGVTGPAAPAAGDVAVDRGNVLAPSTRSIYPITVKVPCARGTRAWLTRRTRGRVRARCSIRSPIVTAAGDVARRTGSSGSRIISPSSAAISQITAAGPRRQGSQGRPTLPCGRPARALPGAVGERENVAGRREIGRVEPPAARGSFPRVRQRRCRSPARGDQLRRETLSGAGRWAADHRRDRQLIEPLARHRHTDQTASVGGHEIDGLARGMPGRHHQIALVLALRVIDYDNYSPFGEKSRPPRRSLRPRRRSRSRMPLLAISLRRTVT